MDHRPSLSELNQAFWRSINRRLHSEQLRALGRSVFVIATVLLMGVLGALLMRRLPPPAITQRDPDTGCTYAAQIIGNPDEAQAIRLKLSNQPFEADWIYMVNTGTCVWTEAVTFRHEEGPLAEVTSTVTAPTYVVRMDLGPLEIPPGGIFGPTIGMSAPNRLGQYTNAWRLHAPNGQPFGPLVNFSIQTYVGPAPASATTTTFPFDIWFIAPAILGVAFAVFRAGRFVAQMYSLQSLSHAIELVLATTFGISNGTVIVAKNGAIEGAEPPPPAKGLAALKKAAEPPKNEVEMRIGGPGVLDVRSGTAVVTERGGSYAGMYGPGEHELRAFEYPRAVLDLRAQSNSEETAVLTKDGVPVRVSVGAIFKFARKMPGETPPPPPKPGFSTVLRAFLRGPNPAKAAGSFPASPEALRAAVYEVHTSPKANPPIKWSDAAFKVAAGEVGDFMSKRLLDQLFAPDDSAQNPRKEIAQLLNTNGKQALAKRGIDLLDSGFGNITVPLEVSEQRQKSWGVVWEKESAITQSRGEAEAIQQIQFAQAEAKAELVQALTQAVRTVNQTAESGEVVHPLAYVFMDTMARMLERQLREAPSDNSRTEMEKLLDRLRKMMGPAYKELKG